MYKVTKKTSYSAWKRMVIRMRNHGKISRDQADNILRVSRAEEFRLVKQLGVPAEQSTKVLGGFSFVQDADTIVIANAIFDDDHRWRCMQEMVMWLKSTISRSFYSRVKMLTSENDDEATKILAQHKFTARPVKVKPYEDHNGLLVNMLYDWSWEVDDRQVPAMR